MPALCGLFCDDRNLCFVENDVVIVVVLLRIEVRVEKFVEMRDGLSGLNGEFEAGLPCDVAYQQEIAAFSFRDERGVLLFGDVIEDFEGVVAGVGLLVDQVYRFLGRMAAVDDGAGREDGRAEKFAGGDLLSPEQVGRAAVEVEDRGYAVRQIERELDGGVEMDVSVGEAGD